MALEQVLEPELARAQAREPGRTAMLHELHPSLPGTRLGIPAAVRGQVPVGTAVERNVLELALGTTQVLALGPEGRSSSTFGVSASPQGLALQHMCSLPMLGCAVD